MLPRARACCGLGLPPSLCLPAGPARHGMVLRDGRREDGGGGSVLWQARPAFRGPAALAPAGREETAGRQAARCICFFSVTCSPTGRQRWTGRPDCSTHPRAGVFANPLLYQFILVSFPYRIRHNTKIQRASDGRGRGAYASLPLYFHSPDAFGAGCMHPAGSLCVSGMAATPSRPNPHPSPQPLSFDGL